MVLYFSLAIVDVAVLCLFRVVADPSGDDARVVGYWLINVLDHILS